MMSNSDFAAKMQTADTFRAQVKSAIDAALSGNPAGAATLRALAATLKDVDDARMYRIALCGEMALKPIRAVLGRIAAGEKTHYRTARDMVDHIGSAAATIAHHRMSEQQMGEALMLDRFPVGARLLRVS